MGRRQLRRRTWLSRARGGLKRSLSVWAAAGLSVALMAPSMAANINIMLVFVRRKLPVAMWQIVIPIAGLIVLGYTLYRNVIPYPTGDGRWFPSTSGVWLLVAVVAVIVAPGTARKLGAALAAREGIKAPDDTAAEVPASSLATAGDETS